MTLVPFAQLLNDGPDWGGRRGETDVNRKRGFKISKTLYLYSDIYSCRVHFYYIGNVCIESLYSNVRNESMYIMQIYPVPPHLAVLFGVADYREYDI